MIDKLDELIAQLEKIRDMGKGKDKDEQIASTSQNILDLSSELILFKITRLQIKEIVDLLNNSIARSDENDPRFSKKDQYEGHWTGTNPRGIITRVQDMKRQISNVK